MTTIRAAVLRGAGDPSVIEDLRLAEPRAGEVRVRTSHRVFVIPTCTFVTAIGRDRCR